MRRQTKSSRIFEITKNGATVLLACVVAVLICSAQQSPLTLQITSPIDNTIVAPGQSISITVTSPTNTPFTAVVVVGEGPLGMTDSTDVLPAQFSLTIPQQIALRTYNLTAEGGVTSDGKPISSNVVHIDVERPDLPLRLNSRRKRIAFASQGGEEPLGIQAAFADGAYLLVTESSRLTFASSNPAVATVDTRGVVKPVGEGDATITVTYTVANQHVSVSVPVIVPRATISSSPHSLNFGDQNLGTSSAPQLLALTNASNNSRLMVGPLGVLGDFSETDNCASLSPIAPAAGCTATVIFTPSVSGTETGTLYVSNSMDPVPVEIALTGTGVGVVQPTTTTTIASTANPSVYGQATTLSSSVTASSGTGPPTGFCNI
jgi:Bacterial Ig-like domain (group 2)